jgi:predicted GNAT family N-acyltransferase
MVLKPIDQNILKMRQVAVHPDFQGKGIGHAMVVYAEVWAARNTFSKIILHARSSAVSFYINLNYSTIGSEFTEVGIPHFAMEKIL